MSGKRFNFKSEKLLTQLLLVSSILASLGGIAAFIILYIPQFHLYWLIVSPIIIAIYQAPAAYLFSLWRKRRKREIEQENKESAPDGI